MTRETFRDLEHASVGISSRHALLWSEPFETRPYTEWARELPTSRFVCGRESDDGGFTATACADVEVVVTDTISWINWE